jgi:hypothetical protein
LDLKKNQIEYSNTSKVSLKKQSYKQHLRRSKKEIESSLFQCYE